MASERPVAANITTLKPAGGSLIMTVPANIRKALSLVAGTQLTVSVVGSKMVIEPVETGTSVKVRKPKYTLEELLADCDFDQPMSEEERAWLDAPPVGREIW